MQTIFENRFQKIILKDGVLLQVYCAESAKMLATDFKQNSIAYLETLQKHKPTYILNDLTEFNYTVSVDEQTWLTEHTKPIYEGSVQKIAVVVPKDFFSQVSVEQFVEETQTAIPLKYFDKIEAAQSWLKEKD